MNKFNQLFVSVLTTLAFTIPIVTHAQEDKPKNNIIAAFLEGDKAILRKLAAEYASKRIDFLDISYLEPNDSNDNGGFAAAYKWKVEINDHWVGANKDNGHFKMRRTSFGLDIDGKYAFGDALNNSNLSTISANFALERGDFGKIKPILNSDAFQDCLVDLEARVPQPTGPAEDPAWDQYAIDAKDFEDACWLDHGIEDIVKANDAAYVYGIDFHGKLEGNQDYDNSNLVYGFTGAFAIQPSFQTRNLNIFDLPFRLMRENVSNNNYVAPLPSFKFDIDRVDASENKIRKSLTTDTDFTRATAEVAFQTILAHIKHEPVRFNISYRYFHEFSAPNEIKAADMDSFDYLALSVRFPARLIPMIETKDYELFFSYTDGQLPFDLQSDKVFEIGIGTNISQLAKLFDN